MLLQYPYQPFHTGIKGFLVDGRTKRESHNLASYIKYTSLNVQLIHVLQRRCHGTTFILQSLILRTIICLTPLRFQLQAFWNQLGSQLFVFIIRISRLELIDVIPLGLIFLSTQSSQICPQIHIIK